MAVVCGDGAGNKVGEGPVDGAPLWKVARAGGRHCGGVGANVEVQERRVCLGNSQQVFGRGRASGVGADGNEAKSRRRGKAAPG